MPDGVAGFVLKSMREHDLIKNDTKLVAINVGDEKHTDYLPSYDKYNPTFLINNWYVKNSNDLLNVKNILFKIKYCRGVKTQTDSDGTHATKQTIYDEYEFFVPKDKLATNFNAGEYTDVDSNEIGKINEKWRKIQKIYSVVFYISFMLTALMFLIH